MIVGRRPLGGGRWMLGEGNVMGAYVDYKFAQIEGLDGDGPVRFVARIYEGDFVPITDEAGVETTVYRRERCLREVRFELAAGAGIEDARAYMNARLAFIAGKKRLPLQTTGGVGADPAAARQPVPLTIDVVDKTVGAVVEA